MANPTLIKILKFAWVTIDKKKVVEWAKNFWNKKIRRKKDKVSE